MVSTRKKRNQQKMQPCQSKATLKDFVIGRNTNVGVIGNETLEPQTNGCYNNLEWIVDGENSECQTRVVENLSDNKVGKTVDTAAMTVENRMHDAILTAMDKVKIPGVEMVVRSITGSSGRGPNIAVQNLDRRDFTGNIENTPLMSASSWLDLNNDEDWIGGKISRMATSRY